MVVKKDGNWGLDEGGNRKVGRDGFLFVKRMDSGR